MSILTSSHAHENGKIRIPHTTGRQAEEPDNTRLHELKILPEYFLQVCDGSKRFEIRKDDRDYRVGDVLVLRAYQDGCYADGVRREPDGSVSWFPAPDECMADEVEVRVLLVLTAVEFPDGLKDGYAVLSIEKCGM